MDRLRFSRTTVVKELGYAISVATDSFSENRFEVVTVLETQSYEKQDYIDTEAI